MKKDNDILGDLFEWVDNSSPFSTDEEKEILSVVSQKSEALTESLNDEQRCLLEEYHSSLSELNYICYRQYFIKGIRFATSFLIEAIYDD